jgi:RNA polymerase sigma-70 factor (ECF subfamily)
MDLDRSTRSTMLDAMPHLHRFAVSLCRDSDKANDLTQETLLRACANIDQFKAGSNMIAWLFTILRNEFYSQHRKRRREIEDVDGSYARSLTLEPEQLAALQYNELCEALDELPAELRRVFIFVSSDDVCYAQAARTFNCAEGTIKSRVHRARLRLAQALSIDWPSGQDKTPEGNCNARRSLPSPAVAARAPD